MKNQSFIRALIALSLVGTFTLESNDRHKLIKNCKRSLVAAIRSAIEGRPMASVSLPANSSGHDSSTFMRMLISHEEAKLIQELDARFGIEIEDVKAAAQALKNYPTRAQKVLPESHASLLAIKQRAAKHFNVSEITFIRDDAHDIATYEDGVLTLHKVFWDLAPECQDAIVGHESFHALNLDGEFFITLKSMLHWECKDASLDERLYADFFLKKWSRFQEIRADIATYLGKPRFAQGIAGANSYFLKVFGEVQWGMRHPLFSQRALIACTYSELQKLETEPITV